MFRIVDNRAQLDSPQFWRWLQQRTDEKSDEATWASILNSPHFWPWLQKKDDEELLKEAWAAILGSPHFWLKLQQKDDEKWDEQAWTALCKRFFRFVMCIATKTLAPEDAEETVDDTFGEVARNYRSLRENSKVPESFRKFLSQPSQKGFLSLLNTTTKFNVIDRIRKRGTQTGKPNGRIRSIDEPINSDSDEPLKNHLPSGDQTNDSSRRAEIEHCVAEVLEELEKKEPERALMCQLRFFDEWENAEIAERFGVSRVTVFRLIKKTREDIRKRLKQRGLEP